MQGGLTIGSRGSPLALWQAEAVKHALCDAHAGLTADGVRIEVIRTSGDRIQDRLLREAGGKGLFTKEIEEALLDGRIDCAVHSAKDMPTELPRGLTLAAFLPREDPRDALIAADAASVAELPPGARVGTASLRRQAQLLRLRPDLEIVPLRGNVGTRIEKIRRGEAEATLMALAGLKRLGLAAEASALLDPEIMLPAPAQGAVCVEIRSDDRRMAELLSAIADQQAAIAATAERAFLAALEGSCRTPIAALARLDRNTLYLEGRLLSPDGRTCFAARREGAADQAASLGREMGLALRAQAGEDFFQAILAAS